MGYAFYQIWRCGEMIDAGYGVSSVCERNGCVNEINRGLGYLCGKTPGGDEYGCGGYFCDEHLGGHDCTGPLTPSVGSDEFR
jgi:hypothetical protein